MALAKELTSKDPSALHATKDAYYYSLDMPFDAAVNYAIAKEKELLVKQKGGVDRTGCRRLCEGSLQAEH